MLPKKFREFKVRDRGLMGWWPPERRHLVHTFPEKLPEQREVSELKKLIRRVLQPETDHANERERTSVQSPLFFSPVVQLTVQLYNYLYSLLSSGQSFADNPEVKTNFNDMCDCDKKEKQIILLKRMSNKLWMWILNKHCNYWRACAYCQAFNPSIFRRWTFKIIPIKILSLTFNTVHVTKS